MKLRAMFLGCVALLAALSPAGAAPTTNHWRAFTKADGLLENSCISLTIGASGNILVRHAKSPVISIFDGYEFTSIPGPGTNRGRIYESPGGQLWTVTTEGLLEFREGEWTPHPVPQIAAHFRAGQTNEVRLQPIRQGRVLIFLPETLLQLDASDPDHAQIEALTQTNQPNSTFTTATLPEDFSVRRVYDTQAEPNGAAWFATSDGLFRQTRELWEVASAPSTSDILPRNERLILTDPDIPPGGWKVSFTAKNGDEWIGGSSGIAWRHRGAVRTFCSTNQLGPEEVFTFTEAPDGRIWCATPRKVWEFDSKNWLPLRGGLEQINALHCARNGTLWVAATSGVHRLAQGAWIANGLADGLPSLDVREIRESNSGQITINTALGASAFHPEHDLDPPHTSVTTPSAEGQFREGAVVTLTFSGCDKWKLTAPARLLFSYRLDEREWSPFMEGNEITFTDLPLGKHYFQVRAMDRAGNIDPKPARLEFTVVVPWYRETRLVLILSIALAVAIFFAGLAFNRHHKLKRSYAEVERQIAERTRELEIANRELLHSQKMNALGSLAAGIAHDFNNILSIIKGSAQIIEDNADKPDKIRTRVDRIKTVVQQGAEVVDAMLGFSRSTDLPPAPCDLNLVVDETRKLLGDRFLREVEVRFERGEHLPQLSVPRDFVQQILLNFIFNAAEAMSGKKQIILTTQLTTKLPTELFLTPATAGNYLTVSVRDCGSGIAPEIKSRIFEPFFTTKALSTKRGTGLGLSMVYELAKKLDAGLAVESVVGQGSTFTLILPVRETKTTS